MATPPPPRWGPTSWLLILGGVGAAAAIVAFGLLAGEDPEPRALPPPVAPVTPSLPVPSPLETVEEVPAEPVAESGRYRGRTEQDSDLSFVVRGGSIVARLKFEVTMTGCSTPDFPTEYRARFDLRAPIGTNGAFSGSAPGQLDFFRGRFVSPRRAEGVLRTLIDAPELENCTSGRVGWTAHLEG